MIRELWHSLRISPGALPNHLILPRLLFMNIKTPTILAIMLGCLIVIPAARVSAQSVDDQRVAELRATIARLQEELRGLDAPVPAPSPRGDLLPPAETGPALDVVVPSVPGAEIAPARIPDGSPDGQLIKTLPAPPADVITASPVNVVDVITAPPATLPFIVPVPEIGCPGGQCPLSLGLATCPGGVCSYAATVRVRVPVAFDRYRSTWRPPYAGPPWAGPPTGLYPGHGDWFGDYHSVRPIYREAGCWLD